MHTKACQKSGRRWVNELKDLTQGKKSQQQKPETNGNEDILIEHENLGENPHVNSINNKEAETWTILQFKNDLFKARQRDNPELPTCQVKPTSLILMHQQLDS